MFFYQPYFLTHKSFIFPMHGPQDPILIDVPVDAHNGMTPTIDDLDIEYWIRPSLAERRVIDLKAVRRHFVRYPETREPLPFGCTVHFEDQSNKQGINRTLVRMGLSANWKGNVVVMKNPTSESYSDMGPEDEGIIVELIKQ